MDFSSTKIVKSQAYPDVSFTIRRMTEGTRTDLMLELADVLAKIRDIQADVSCLDLPPRKADGEFDETVKVDPHLFAQAAALNDKIRVIRKNTVDPSYARVCFVGVQNLTIDGTVNPTDIEFIRRFGPERLFGDIIAAIRAEVEMSDEEKENLESPTTSDAQAGGQMSDTTASIADKTDSTLIAIVPSSSQPT